MCVCVCANLLYVFVIARTWKHPKCPSTDEWIRKKWYIYSMKYYTADKNILNFSGKWMELENITMSEVTQTQKDNYHIHSFIGGF